MHQYLQLHLLTAYPPSNLNRDETGRPKTARFGAAPRLRISSQSLKRAWRTSDVFAEHLLDHISTHTRLLGRQIRDRLIGHGTPTEEAVAIGRAIGGVFGKIKPTDDKEPMSVEQLVIIAPEERERAFAMADEAASKGVVPKPPANELLMLDQRSADIAMFGRMLADARPYNVDAAVQVSHAITTHRAAPEVDYYTAVDDAAHKADNDSAAGFVDTQEFGSGVFYVFVCIDRLLLLRNVRESTKLWKSSIQALVRAAATVAPTGKQNSYASRARASYVLAELGDRQPRTLATSFLVPCDVDQDPMQESVKRLEKFRAKMDRGYGECSARHTTFDIERQLGTLDEVAAFAHS